MTMVTPTSTVVSPPYRRSDVFDTCEQVWTIPAGKVTAHEIRLTGDQLVTGYLVSQTKHDFDFRIQDPYGNVVLFNRRVTNQRFAFRATSPGSYWLVVDNHLSLFRSKTVRVTYSVWG